ncbi:ABC transporter permease [Aquirufa rosea]|uniref:ABC transporter permease n=1 Tax=Aquirufa rosea TaxID=2509241 RepID=A0A4Q1BY39_9BACT|nr:FtsX-like permease family protein [Aquirufa rosea]RXK47585.1 ABC transporter permease [Aquirufa rosea]
MNFPLFVARRIRNTHETSFSKTVTYVGIGTVSIGVCIILVAFSILFGFKESIVDKLTSFTGNIHVGPITGNHSLSDSPLKRNLTWEKGMQQNPEVDHIQAHIQKPGILVGDAGLSGVIIKGIGTDMPANQISKSMRLGKAQLKHPQDIIISKTLAKELKVGLHNHLILYFLSNPERPRKVTITGIYETGLEELDKMYILADLSWVQKMNGWSADSIGTYEVFLKKTADLYYSADRIESKMPTEWRLQTVTELYPALFDWMMMLDRNIVIFISLLLIVACFNLIATLWVLIMERIPMVGLLKALGANHRQIRTIFWWNGFFILLRGLIIGNLLAVIFCYIQSEYQLIPLDPESYYMDAVPIVWSMSTWLWVNVGTSLLVAIIITLPTLFIKKIQAQEALQYKH